MEYLVVPFLIPMKISGWQSSQPFQTVCFLWEKIISGIPAMLPSNLRSFWIGRKAFLTGTLSRESTSVISPSLSAFTQSMPLPDRFLGIFAAKTVKSFFLLEFLPEKWHL